MDDQVLVKAHLKGDKNAFEVLVKKYQNAVGHLCYSVVKNETAVADVMQDVFLAAHRGLKKFRGDSSFKTWLYKITINESLRYLKKSRKINSIIQNSPYDTTSSEMTLLVMDNRGTPENVLLNTQKKQLIKQAMEQLSEHHRVVMHLHYQEDIPVQDIAEILDIPMGSVKSRLFYARLSLKELLEPFFEQNDIFTEDGEKNVL